MGTRGSGKNGEDLAGDYYELVKEDQYCGLNEERDKILFWSYLVLKLSGPLDLKGMHPFLLIENKMEEIKRKLQSIGRD